MVTNSGKIAVSSKASSMSGNSISEIPSKKLRSDLRYSVIDGAAFGGMVGLGETYIPAFALAVGLGEMAAGMVSSIPLIVGGVMQLASPMAVRALGSHRRWVVLCAAIQSLVFIPLIIAALTGAVSITGLLAVAAVYWGTGLATGPAWNTWIGTIVPRVLRPKFFAHRTRVSQAGVFIGFLTGGLILQFASVRGHEVQAFATIFGLAGLCRVLSTWMLQRKSEPVPLPTNMRQIPWKNVRHHLRTSCGGRLLVYLVVVQASVQIAGPFFTPFMLKKLGFTYGELVTLFSVAFLCKVIAFPIWGRVVKQLGAQKLLWIGGIGIVPMSAGWVVSQNFVWLGFLQVITGIFWAAYELAFFLMFFESIAEEERTSVLTLFNLLNTTAWVVGSLIGGAILLSFDASIHAYLFVFILSSVGRLAALLLLARVPATLVDSDEMGVRTVAVRPGAASLEAPVLASLPDQGPDGDLDRNWRNGI